MESIKDLFSKGKFFILVDQYLEYICEFVPIKEHIEQTQEYLENLQYLLAACEYCGYYCDYLKLLKKYDQILPLKNISCNHSSLVINFLTGALESLVYCLYNNQNEDLGIEYNIAEQIEKLIQFQDTLIFEHKQHLSQRQIELRNLYEDYKAGKLPIYTVEYLYPYEPITKDYIFDLSSCSPYISLEVCKVTRQVDNYTSFKFKVYGLIKPDLFWKGPKWETREKLPPVKKTLNIANMLLLQAIKASPGKIVLPYSINQVSTVSMYQYRWNETEPILNGTISGTDFTADLTGKNARWHQFTDEEMVRLNQAIVSTYGSEPFVTTFHHATNLFSGGFYLEAFLLFCSCFEGMIYYWFEKIAKQHNIFDEYINFSRTKISKCDTCEYFLSNELSNKGKKPYNGMVPSIYANVNYLYKHGCFSKEEASTINKLINKIRNESLRNNTFHGRNSIIEKNVTQRSYEGIMELQSLLVKISNRFDSFN